MSWAFFSNLKKAFRQPFNISIDNMVRFEKMNRSVGGNALRAAVLGGNDGLVSNFSLVMGIAGATSGQSEILLAGLIGQSWRINSFIHFGSK